MDRIEGLLVDLRVFCRILHRLSVLIHHLLIVFEVSISDWHGRRKSHSLHRMLVRHHLEFSHLFLSKSLGILPLLHTKSIGGDLRAVRQTAPLFLVRWFLDQTRNLRMDLVQSMSELDWQDSIHLEAA